MIEDQRESGVIYVQKRESGSDLEEEEGFWKEFKRENGDRNATFFIFKNKYAPFFDKFKKIIIIVIHLLLKIFS